MYCMVENVPFSPKSNTKFSERISKFVPPFMKVPKKTKPQDSLVINNPSTLEEIAHPSEEQKPITEINPQDKQKEVSKKKKSRISQWKSPFEKMYIFSTKGTANLRQELQEENQAKF